MCPNAVYNVEVDWNGDGDFSDTLENISSETKTMWFHRGKDAELEQSPTGLARITVLDANGKYIPQNTSSAIVATYGGIYPGRAIRLRATYTSTYTLLYTHLDDVSPEPERSKRQAMLSCVDGFDQLQRAKINLALHENFYSGGNSSVIAAALDAAGWPADKRDIDAGQLDAYPVIWAEGQTALDFIHQIEESEFGLCYINRNGNFAWEDRHYRLSATRATTSQATITENEFIAIRPANSLKDVRNKIIYRALPKTKVASEMDVWTLTEDAATSSSPSLAAGETKTFWAQFADANGVPNIAGEVQEVASGDYAGDSAQGFTSGDRTSWLSVSTQIFAAAAKVQVKNSGNQAVYLSQLAIRGKIYTDEAPLEIIEQNASSQAVYGYRDLEREMPWYINADMMRGRARHVLAQKKNPIPSFEIELINGGDAELIQILARDVSDRITLQSTTWNISGDYYIDAVEHSISNGGKVHWAKWWVSRADDQEYWILGQSLLGVGTRLSY